MKKLPEEDRAGLYITVIIHLAVLIVALASGLKWSLEKENSFVLDFTKQEEVERLQKELSFKEEISRRLQEQIDAYGSEPVRNIAVDRGSLKDDRGTDADELYKDAERLQRELSKGFKAEDDVVEEKKDENEAGEKKEEKTYSGPSVVSYLLEGRKASKLSIPSYRCMGAGEVTVLITVDNAGNVVNAKVDESVSSNDSCLKSFAIRAARLSRFSASPSAPERQAGNIVYSFIAQ